MKQDDDKLLKDARALLEHRADDLDDLVVARLRAARLRATEVAGKRQQRFAWLKSAGGLIAASLVIAELLRSGSPIRRRRTTALTIWKCWHRQRAQSFIRISIFICGWMRGARVPVNKAMLTLAMLLVVSPARSEEIPDIEMLEYLGNWETANGRFIDPLELEAEDVAEVEQQEKVSDEQ